MALFSKQIASGSTNGKSIAINTASGPGVALHTAHATAKDEVWLYVTNISAVSETFILTEDSVITDKIIIPAQQGRIRIIPGITYTGSVVIKGYSASVTTALFASLFVNRIT